MTYEADKRGWIDRWNAIETAAQDMTATARNEVHHPSSRFRARLSEAGQALDAALALPQPGTAWMRPGQLPDFTGEQLKAAALAAMRELADQEPEGWDRDLQLRAIAAADAGEMDDQWPKSERAIRVFLKALSGAAQ